MITKLSGRFVSIFYFNCENFLFVYIVKQKDSRILFGANFWYFDHLYIFHGDRWSHTKNLDPIGSAVLTFIGYKGTDKHTDKQSTFILYRRVKQFTTFFIKMCFFLNQKNYNLKFKWTILLRVGNFENNLYIVPGIV